MKRIAILGCENSHADTFLEFVRDKKEFRDIEVVGIYSDETEVAQKLAKTFGVPVLENYADAVGKIDALVITARHGDNHYKYAKPYIASGVPMFVDKPVTISEEEAIVFMRELKAGGIRVCGGSSLKQDPNVRALKADAEADVNGATVGGFVRAPYEAENEYGGFHFYSQHLVEMVSEIFGRFPKSVTARKTGKQISVMFHYDAYDVAGLYVDCSYKYFVSRAAMKGTTAYEIVIPKVADEWFTREFQEISGLMDGKAQSLSYEEFIAPVFVMNAISRSMESGREEPVNKFEI